MAPALSLDFGILRRFVFLLAGVLGLAIFSFATQSLSNRPAELVRASEARESLELTFLVSSAPVEYTQFGTKSQSFEGLVQIGKTRALVEVFHSGDEALVQGSTYKSILKFAPGEQKSRIGIRGSTVGVVSLVSSNSVNVFGLLRTSFLDSLKSVDQDSMALVAGLAIGERSLTPESLAKDMKVVSLTHLMAVSGANCAIVAGTALLALQRVRVSRLIRTVLAVSVVAGYVGLVGPEPSVIRAGFMACVVLVAVAAGRKVDPISALGFAVICLLVTDPWLSINFGFGLSVAATAGILILTPAIYLRLKQKMPRFLALGISVSIGSQVFCFPIILQLQSGISTYSVVANLLAEPLVAPVTILGILCCSIAWFLPGIAGVLSYIASLATWCIANIAHEFARLPLATLKWLDGIAATIVAISVAISLVVLLKVRSGFAKLTANLILVGVLGSTLVAQIPMNNAFGRWPSAGWQIVQCNVGQGDALVLRSEQRIAVIDVGREPAPIKECLDSLSISQIDLLVLTHFDMDHVGGLEGALSGRTVKSALVSPFEDPRWAASKSLERLREIGCTVSIATEGDSGHLGKSAWRVVGPAIDTENIEDSNDGSLVMAWNLDKFSLITMADSGERAQQFIAAKNLSWLNRWGGDNPLVMKVSHHGSADQYPELLEELDPDVSLISVGAQNQYGHPTMRTLNVLERVGSRIFRTDEDGAISISADESGIHFATTGRG